MRDRYNHTDFYYIFMALVMCITSGLVCFGAGYLQGEKIGYNIAGALLGILIMAAIMLYLEGLRAKSTKFDYKIANYIRIFVIFLGMCIVTFGLRFLPSQIRPFFAMGAVFALVTNKYVGILFQIYFSILASGIYEPAVESLVFNLLAGVVCCLISEYFIQKKTFIYAIVTALTISVSFWEILFYISNGNITHNVIIDSFFCTVIGLAVIGLAIPYTLYVVNVGDTKKLTELCNTEYELMVMLENTSPELYNHSKRVGDLAEMCANIVGANPLVAKAGGYYQKIGKLEGKEFIKYGVEIGEAYDFPKSVIDIIKQQNGRKERPQTLEAAIVIMCDTVISAFEIVDDKKNELAYDRELIVEQVLRNKIERDIFDESGMTIKMYRDLKKCFKQEENIL